MRCRKRRDVTETRLQSLAWDPAEEIPAYGLGGDRHKGGVISVPALAGNVGSWSPRWQGKATRGRPPRATLPRRGTGSDQPIVALKPGNAGGAKGLNGSALWDGSTRKGRNSCRKRGRVCRLSPRLSINPQGEESMADVRPYTISKQVVWDAYSRVKANKGAAGVDGQSIEAFESDLKNNLYKIWNRMSSGTYFPPPVKAVEIPKPHGGGTRILGVPTVTV